jgi:subtilisin family serine protease
VVVRFDVPSLAAYRGGIAGLAATSPAIRGEARLGMSSPETKAYRKFLENKTATFREAVRRRIPRARIIHKLDVVVGGVSVLVPEDQVAELYRLPGVSRVYADEVLHLDTLRSPRFLGATALWAALGGQQKAGEGLIVAALDGGVWPELDSFSDPDPSGRPYPAPPAKWSGTSCEFGNIAWNPNDAAFACNNKLIGADRFMATYELVEVLNPTEFRSARDDDGHGTHTLSTAGGNSGVDPAVTFDAPTLPEISGIAPRAHVVAYKVCGIEGCYSSDSAAAVQQAIEDGVDVINFSISGGDNPYSDVVSQAFLDAYEAGIFVATSAGNDGPGPDTVSHREPWTTTVAASTSDVYMAGTLSLVGSGTLELVGTSITGDVSGPVVLASNFHPTGDPGCLTPFPAGTWTNGEIVICARGDIARVTKGENVLAGGARGLILYNPTPNSIDHDKHFLPAIHVDANEGVALLAFMAAQSGPVTGSITQGVLRNVETHPGGPPSLFPGTAGGSDVIADFSSRGGPGQTLGISKPDVTATGVAILAGGTPMPNDSGEASSFGALGEYMFISGTSMSSPHVAGAAALLKDLHPNWTPWQIKSALMTTARNHGVVKEDGVTPADPFDYGSGRIDLRQAGSPGLSFLSPTRADFEGLANELWHVNYPSLYIPVHPGKTEVKRTLRSERKHTTRWFAWVTSSKDLDVEVEPELFVIKPGQTRTVEIEVDSRDVPLGEVRHATLHLSDSDDHLDFPITIVKRQGAVTLTKSCDPTDLNRGEQTECVIEVTNTSFDTATVSLRDRIPSELEVIGTVTGATGKRVLTFTGDLQAAEPPNVSAVVDPLASPAGYLPLSLFGGNLVLPAGDESLFNITGIPPFDYAGVTYDALGVTSNGYAVVGGGDTEDIDYINQNFPDPTRPNNVLAPCWTDMNPAAGGRILVNVLSAGNDLWTVVEWEKVPNFFDGNVNTCQIWIGAKGNSGGDEDISFTYGPDISTGDGGFMTVGAENPFGNRGASVYFDGNGTAPAPSFPNGNFEVDVFSTPGAPGETHTISFTAKAVDTGRWKNCAEMETAFIFGTTLACVEGEVTKRKH